LRKVDSLLVFSKTRHLQDPSLSTSSYRFDTGGISICIQNLADRPLGCKNIFFYSCACPPARRCLAYGLSAAITYPPCVRVDEGGHNFDDFEDVPCSEHPRSR